MAEFPPEIYAQILDSIEEPETYQALAKTNRQLRSLALHSETLKKAKERFFHGIDPYLYKQAKYIVESFTDEQFQCEGVNRKKIDLIVNILHNTLLIPAKAIGTEITDEELIDEFARDLGMECLPILLGLNDSNMDFGVSPDWFTEIADKLYIYYSLSFRGVVQQVLNDYGLY